MDRFDNVLETALGWHNAGKKAVLATVVQTWGSAPRKVGSQMAVSGQGEIEGSVSGGCVEGAVVTEALDALEDGQPRMLEYGVSDGDAFAVGLACGGTIRIWLEPVGDVLPVDHLQRLIDARLSRKAVGYLCNVKTGQRSIVGPDDFPDRFRLDRSGFEVDEETFVTIHNPPLRLAIVGAVHIAQALVPLAKVSGFDPFIIDPREAFATRERFPDVEISHEWPDDALREVGIDARTAVVLLTHDPKLDDPAIHLALQSDVFYIGALGSKRTQASRLERLRKAGFSEKDISRIHGPVGLDIGSSNPSEIALSIMAEIVSVLRNPS